MDDKEVNTNSMGNQISLDSDVKPDSSPQQINADSTGTQLETDTSELKQKINNAANKTTVNPYLVAMIVLVLGWFLVSHYTPRVVSQAEYDAKSEAKDTAVNRIQSDLEDFKNDVEQKRSDPDWNVFESIMNGGK